MFAGVLSGNACNATVELVIFILVFYLDVHQGMAKGMLVCKGYAWKNKLTQK